MHGFSVEGMPVRGSASSRWRRRVKRYGGDRLEQPSGVRQATQRGMIFGLAWGVANVGQVASAVGWASIKVILWPC